MKRFTSIICTFVALAISACRTDSGFDSTIVNDSSSITVSLEQTRTSLGVKSDDIYPVYWSEGDRLAVNGVLSEEAQIDESNPSIANFKVEGSLTYPISVVYPYSTSTTADKAIVEFPAEQFYTANTFASGYAPMCGYATTPSGKLTLSHLSTILRFPIKSALEGIVLEKVVITSTSGIKLAGEFEVDCANARITPTAKTQNSITYSLPANYALSTSEVSILYVTLPAVNAGDCTVEFVGKSGKKMFCAWNANDIKGGVVKEFSTITFKEGGLSDIVMLKELDSEDASEQLEFRNIFGYVKDNNGQPIEGMAVSDGFIVTTTDSNGYYEMSPSSDAYYIFISLPAEYEVPINEFGQPTFYQRYPGKQQYDFTLTPLAGGKEKKFAIFAMADPQIWNNLSMTRFRDEAIPGIAAHVAEVAQSLPCYGITLGDIASTNFSKSGNSEEYREPLRDLFSKSIIGMPVFQVMGNHDAIYAYHAGGVDPKPDRYNSTWQIKMQRGHESVFGPANYSFNRGDVHFVGMRNIEYYMGSDNEYAARLGFLPEQIEWLRQDLAVVPKDKMIVFCAHIPLFSKQLDSVDSVMAILAQFENVHILTGHQHINQNYEHEVTTTKGVKIFEHNVGTVCGSWWDSNMALDGTPVGYQVFTCEGNDFSDWYYIGFTEGMNKRSHQMRLYRGDDITGGAKSGTDSYGVKGYYKFNYASDILLANVYNADSAWKVEVYEDGIYSGEMSLIPNNVRPYHDNKVNTTTDGIGGDGSFTAPYYSTVADISSDMHFAGLYLGILGKKDRQYNTKGDCFHMYKYKLKRADAKIMVKATDRFGNIYTETKITKGTDYSITGCL